MKQILKPLICLVLCISVVLSVASCDLLTKKDKHPEGYTGGFCAEPHFYSNREIHWLETYDEAMEAIRHLVSAGNEIPRRPISSYENEFVDAKYCFNLNTYRTPELKEGEEWYDRKFHSITIFYIGFLDDITVEELEYSYYEIYKHIRVTPDGIEELYPHDSRTYECVRYDAWYKNDMDDGGYTCYVVREYDNEYVARIRYYNIEDHLAVLPESFHQEFADSVIYIGTK